MEALADAVILLKLTSGVAKSRSLFVRGGQSGPTLRPLGGLVSPLTAGRLKGQSGKERKRALGVAVQVVL